MLLDVSELLEEARKRGEMDDRKVQGGHDFGKCGQVVGVNLRE